MILDGDPVQIGETAPDDLLKIQVVETVLEGETVYRVEAQGNGVRQGIPEVF